LAIVVVGSVALDSIETPFGNVDDVLGGSASYFSLSASLYAPVELVAVVGEDFPGQYMDELRVHPIDLAGLRRVPGETFRWGGRYHLDMNTRDTLFTRLGVFADFAPDIPPNYRSSPILFLGNIHPQLQLNVLREMDSQGQRPLRALDTMNLWIEGERETLTEVIRQVDVMLLAEEEARQFADTPSLRAAARHILGLGPQRLVIKQGSHGALLFSRDGGYYAAPAYPLEDVRDPTGAGDSFAGGFLGYLAQRLRGGAELTDGDFHRALIHGNILGSYACEQFSVGRLLTLSPDAIATRYGEFVRFTHFEGSWQTNGTNGTNGVNGANGANGVRQPEKQTEA
jgi:sugar/nucleoside kinase (ribokinase family)